MKIDVLDAHDRVEHLKKQSFSIADCCQDLINQRPFGDVPFYIFAHARTDDDGVTKRLIWQPRLTKPKAQTNSMLFKVCPGTENVKVIWMIPPREYWDSFEKGKVTESEIVRESIENFQNNRELLEKPEDDDLSDDKIDAIYREISRSNKYQKLII